MKPELFYQNQNFDYRYLKGREERFCWTLKSTEPATAGNYSVFAQMPKDGVVIDFWESHGTACSSTGTLQLEKLTSGTALDSGTELLTAALDLDTTADTPQRGILSNVPSTVQFVAGDRFAIKDALTLTATANLTVVLSVKYKNA